MKYRIALGENSLDGSPIYRIYRVDGDTSIYCNSAGTEDKAREMVHRLMNPQPEVTIAEIEL